MIRKCLITIALLSVVATGFCNTTDISAIVRAKMAFVFGGISQWQIDQYYQQFKHNFKSFDGCHMEPIFDRSDREDLKNWQIACSFGGLQGYFQFVPYYQVVEGIQKAKKQQGG